MVSVCNTYGNYYHFVLCIAFLGMFAKLLLSNYIICIAPINLGRHKATISFIQRVQINTAHPLKSEVLIFHTLFPVIVSHIIRASPSHGQLPFWQLPLCQFHFLFGSFTFVNIVERVIDHIMYFELDRHSRLNKTCSVNP